MNSSYELIKQIDNYESFTSISDEKLKQICILIDKLAVDDTKISLLSIEVPKCLIFRLQFSYCSEICIDEQEDLAVLADISELKIYCVDGENIIIDVQI